MRGTDHFQQRLQQRGAKLSKRKALRLETIYGALKTGDARISTLNGRYAIQFGGEPQGAGDYLIVQINNGAVGGFISLLADQRVIMPDTRIIPAKRIMPRGAYKNPRVRARRNPQPFTELVNRRLGETEQALGGQLPVGWDIGPYEHFLTKRGFGVTFLHRGNDGPVAHMRFAEKLLQAPQHRQDGIIRHEIGHVVDHVVPTRTLNRWARGRNTLLPPARLAEIRADAIAEAIWQSPILYDRSLVQSTTRGAYPRPKKLGW